MDRHVPIQALHLGFAQHADTRVHRYGAPGRDDHRIDVDRPDVRQLADDVGDAQQDVFDGRLRRGRRATQGLQRELRARAADEVACQVLVEGWQGHGAVADPSPSAILRP